MINLFAGTAVVMTGFRGKAVQRAEVSGFEKCGELGEGKDVDALTARTFDL